MRISLLLQREPFDRIIEKTLKTFLDERYKCSYNVKWVNSRSFNSKKKDSQLLLCNYYLNAIFDPEIKKSALRPVIQEFSRSTKPWWSPLQKFYVYLATTKNLAQYFASAYIEIIPSLSNSKEILIIGGNHHIRLLDYSKNCCFVIHKEGFNNEFQKKEISLRSENRFLPTPKILEIGKNQQWYSEELILGTPINRLKDKTKAWSCVEEVAKPLFQLLEDEATKESAIKYADKLKGEIKGLSEQSHLIEQNKKGDILGICEDLGKIIHSSCKKVGDEIILSQTHGDFQPANIMESETGPWLIDWEYTDRRQIIYDGLVFTLQSRFSRNLAQRIIQALETGAVEGEELLKEWPQSQWQDKEKRRLNLSLFILEEILLKLKENDNKMFKALGHSFDEYISEIKLAANYFSR